MAIDKNKLKKLLEDIDDMFYVIAKDMSKETRDLILEKVLGPAVKDIKEIIENGRDPRLMILGRSGHGKSSLINALAKKKIAETSDVKPGTYGSEKYIISFPEYYSTWAVIDSRGFFDPTRPVGATEDDALKQLKDDIKNHKPDILMHVINIRELRASAKDMEALQDIRKKIKKESKLDIPSIIVLTNVDTLGNPREWPLEDYPAKIGLLQESLDYLTDEILKIPNKELIDLNVSYRGYKLNHDKYIGVIPVCTLEGDYWNIDTLARFIGEYLPEEAKLNFFQARNEMEEMKGITTQIIKRFSTYASLIGTTPIPIADSLILTPLQILMITLIGALAGKELKVETAHEYLAAVGINLGAAYGARTIARQLLKIVPIGGSVISGGIAGSATYAIGKSAEAFFFHGRIKKPGKIRGK